jgi:hypothetical protein
MGKSLFANGKHILLRVYISHLYIHRLPQQSPQTACSKTEEPIMTLKMLILALLTVLVRAASLIREPPCDACVMLKASYPHITFYPGQAAYEFETRTREASLLSSRSHDC